MVDAACLEAFTRTYWTVFFPIPKFSDAERLILANAIDYKVKLNRVLKCPRQSIRIHRDSKAYAERSRQLLFFCHSSLKNIL